MTAREFFSWKGKVSRGTYALVGSIGFAIKHNLDRFIAFGFGEKWSLWSYWAPIERFSSFHALTANDKRFLAALLVTALPFIWIGLTMTIKRLRDAGQPAWLSALFFAPFINLIFFIVVAIYPPESGYQNQATDRSNSVSPFWPCNTWGSAELAVLVSSLIGVLGAWIAIKGLGSYGLGLFLALPFAMGYVAVWVHSRAHHRSYINVLALVSLSVLLAGAGIAAIAIEGIICLVMAAPIAWILALLGGSLAYVIHTEPGFGHRETSTFGAVLLVLPLLLGVEHASPPPVPRFQVRTSIEIAAPPDLVWKRIIAFPPMDRPNELVFRYAGIAYPIEARIKGAGLTADRECRFSTGSFKEPILAWEPGKHFAFGVADEPLLMTETSPYGQIHVRHLDDHDFQPERADFVLASLANGGTRLEGTTIYQNKMWPGMYWRLYTDVIVHTIHRRVFEHVKQLAEGDAKTQAVAARDSDKTR
jgi:uncharacterized membrane protein YhaH (DUF805 family)